MADVSGSIRGPAPGPTVRERFFIECDKNGRILWMNAGARQRLGPADNLLSAMEIDGQSDARRVLKAGDSPALLRFTCSLMKRDSPDSMPVQFTRLLARRGSVLLSAQVRERAVDSERSLAVQAETLNAMEHKTSRNYVSLKLAEEKFRRKAAAQVPMPRPTVGELVSESVEEERSRLARDLHAGVGQALVAIKLHAGVIRNEAPAKSDVVEESLRRIEHLTDQALEEVRSASRRLHPPDWQQLGLREALEVLWESSGIALTAHATLELGAVTPEPSQGVKVAVYRCAQEGLSNVLRHARATEVRMMLETRDGRLDFELWDNGIGFDSERAFAAARGAEPRGIGLRSMRRQIRALNGSFEIHSGADGTALKLSLPAGKD